jgi:hypothetical protein
MKHLFPLLLAASLSSLAGSAFAGLLGIDDNCILRDINPANAVTSNPRVVGNKIYMIACAPNGTLYGVSQGFPTDVPPGGMLYKINVTTGVPTYVATLDTYVIVEGDIAFDPTSGTLYAIDSQGQLFTINTTTGAGTVIGTLPGNIDLSAMTFDAAGNLYMVESFGQNLLKVNKTNATVVATLPMGNVGQQVGGLAFVPGNGTLYYAGDIPGKFYSVNTTTGLGTLINPISPAVGIWALAYIPDPTPVRNSTWGRIKALYR